MDVMYVISGEKTHLTAQRNFVFTADISWPGLTLIIVYLLITF